MRTGAHILLLAGSLEARQLAGALAARGLSCETWVSEAPRGAAPLPQAPQLRRFADAQAMQAAVMQGGFTAIVDAGHGFDAQATAQGFAAARALGLPHVRLLRPPWDLPAQQRVPDARAANARIGAHARVFCTTGRDSLPDFAGFAGEVLLLRQTRRHALPVPYPFVEPVFGVPPFTAAAEQALFAALRVDTLVCRNIGGEVSMTKLEAAEALGITLIAIDRPEGPPGMVQVAQPEAARDWVLGL